MTGELFLFQYTKNNKEGWYFVFFLWFIDYKSHGNVTLPTFRCLKKYINHVWIAASNLTVNSHCWELSKFLILMRKTCRDIMMFLCWLIKFSCDPMYLGFSSTYLTALMTLAATRLQHFPQKLKLLNVKENVKFDSIFVSPSTLHGAYR